jgi:hypothetical protein
VISCSFQNRKILKRDVQKALKLQPSWFTDAKKGQELLSIYGIGGSNESKAVIKEMETVRDPPHGWTALLKYLKKHHRKHQK